MHIVDQNTDTTFNVLREIVIERSGFGDTVKTAEVGQDVRTCLPNTAFADPDNRLFPVHTPENALLSKAYATKQASVDSSIIARIDHAMELYEVELPELTQTKQAAAPVVYALAETKQFPIRSAEDVARAEDAVLRNAKKLSADKLASAACTLVKEAASLDVPVTRKTMALAGLVQCDVAKTAEWIEARSQAAPAGEEHYLKLATWVQEFTESGTKRSELTKLADTVGELDSLYGLTRFYGKSLPTPMETVFNTKTALSQDVDLAGTDVSLEKLLKLDPGVYEDLFGGDILSEITTDGELDPSKLTEIISTLPRDMKVMLVKVTT
tara:strand:+ start:7346 stop:8320 length:975 start_codon:yes stop_codon:yes gene_type:complete